MDDAGTILRTADLTLDEMVQILDGEMDMLFVAGDRRCECDWDLLHGK